MRLAVLRDLKRFIRVNGGFQAGLVYAAFEGVFGVFSQCMGSAAGHVLAQLSVLALAGAFVYLAVHFISSCLTPRRT